MHGLIFNVTRFPYLSRPLGGHRIAHYLREKSWDIEVVDWANWWTVEQLKSFFQSRISPRTVFVGFSHLFNIWSPVLEEFGGWIKSTYPNIKLISGSAVNPMFSSDCLDYYIQGFGEYALEALLKYINGNGPIPFFNLTAPNGLKVISAIHSYPAFPLKSLMVKYEARDFIEPDEWLTIETSRGCVFNCAFCNFPVLGVKEDYTRDSEDFGEQLRDAYDRFGVSNYIMADETFNDRADKIKKFADVIEKLDFDTWFSGYIRADLMTARPGELDELLRMNFLGHYYGIESFNSSTARAVGKGMDPNRLKQGLADARKYFESHGSGRYRGSIGLIMGLPNETESMMMDTVVWLIENWQRQSFSLRPLVIPVNNQVNKSSKISENLLKYGYSEIEKNQIPAKQKIHSYLPDTYVLAREEVIWRNDHTDWFESREFCNKILAQKKQHDFRPNCHYISYRLGDRYDLSSRLDFTYPEFDQNLNFRIDQYIEKKLSL